MDSSIKGGSSDSIRRNILKLPIEKYKIHLVFENFLLNFIKENDVIYF